MSIFSSTHSTSRPSSILNLAAAFALSCLLLCCFQANVHAQVAKTLGADSSSKPAAAVDTVDVVYLRTGSVFTGRLIVQKPSVHYILQLDDGTKLEFLPHEIDQLKREPRMSADELKKREAENYNDRKIDTGDESARVDTYARIDKYDAKKLRNESYFYLAQATVGLAMGATASDALQYSYQTFGFVPDISVAAGTRLSRRAFIGAAVSGSVWTRMLSDAYNRSGGDFSTTDLSLRLIGLATDDNFLIDGSIGPLFRSYEIPGDDFLGIPAKTVSATGVVINGGVHYVIRGTFIGLDVHSMVQYVDTSLEYGFRVGVSFCNLFPLMRGTRLF